MGYFSDGTEADFYEAEYCMKCLHYDKEQADSPYACPVLLAHWWCASNARAKFADDNSPEREVLDTFIPRDADGVNQACTMQMIGDYIIGVDHGIPNGDFSVIPKPKEPEPVPCEKNWKINQKLL